MKRISFLVLCSLLSLSFCWAQDKIKFNETTHDFGKIEESGGPVSCEFIVTNTSSAPIVISRVAPSCGCTTPAWTKEPIAPGKTGFIRATYHPTGRGLGFFTKTVTVYTSAQDAPTTLTFKGEAVQKKNNPESEYPIEFGNLRLKMNNVNLGQVPVTETRNILVEVFNNGTSPISLKFDKLPKHIVVGCEPTVIPEKTAAKMNIKINYALAKKYGKIDDSFNVVVSNDAKSAPKNIFKVNAILIDDFSKLSPSDKANAPKMNVPNSQIALGKTDKGAVSSSVLKISNSGKTALNLYNIVSNNSAVILTKNKAIIKPGEIFELKVSLSKQVTAPLNTTISMVTNDPNAPIKDVAVVANP